MWHSCTNNKYDYLLARMLILDFLERRYDKIIYVDCDILFFKNPDILFDTINEDLILLNHDIHHRRANTARSLGQFMSKLTQEEQIIASKTKFSLNCGFVGLHRKNFNFLDQWKDLYLSSEKTKYCDQEAFNFVVYKNQLRYEMIDMNYKRHKSISSFFVHYIKSSKHNMKNDLLKS